MYEEMKFLIHLEQIDKWLFNNYKTILDPKY